MRLQSSRSFRRTVQDGKDKLDSVPWLDRSLGLLLSWLQKAGAGEAAGSGPKRKGLLSIFADHCSFVTGQRLRRACQIAELYSNLYSERTRKALVGNIWRKFQSKHTPTGKLIAAMAGIFIWDNEKIKDEEIHRLEMSLHMHVCGCCVDLTDYRVRETRKTGWRCITNELCTIILPALHPVALWRHT